LHKKKEKQCREEDCQNKKEDDRLRRDVSAYGNATTETDYKVEKRTMDKSHVACAFLMIAVCAPL
jgi:hypothetical protein